MKRTLSLLIALSLLCLLLPFGASFAEEEQVRVLLSTGNHSSFTVPVNGSYLLGETLIEGGELTLSVRDSALQLTHSVLGSLYEGEEGIMLTPTGSEKGYLSFTTANDKLRKYTGSFFFEAFEGSVRVINHVPMTDYMAGVTVPEVGRDAHSEILKAAALCAKGYALVEMDIKKPYDVDDTSSDQLYYGYFPDADTVLSAVEAVKDYTLLYEGKPVKTHYSSSNGGVVLTPLNRWGGNAAYEGAYLCRYDPFDLLSSSKNSLIPIRSDRPDALPAKLTALLLEQSGADSILRIDSLTGYNTLGNDKRYPAAYAPQNGFKIQLTVSKAGEQQQTQLDIPFAQLQSQGILSGSVSFALQVGEGQWHLCSGSSSGPRVGMSHKGAQQMAKAGYSFVEILKFYYPGGQLINSKGQLLSPQKDTAQEAVLQALASKIPMPEPGPVEPPAPTNTPEPTHTPASTATLEPSPTPESTATVEPTATQGAEATAAPGETAQPGTEPTLTPEPTNTPGPTVTPESTYTPEPTHTPEPTATPEPTFTPEPTATPEPTFTPEPTALPPLAVGDISDDGRLSAMDAALILRYLSGAEELTPRQLEAADINGDGTVTYTDASLLLQRVVE